MTTLMIALTEEQRLFLLEIIDFYDSNQSHGEGDLALVRELHYILSLSQATE